MLKFLGMNCHDAYNLLSKGSSKKVYSYMYRLQVCIKMSVIGELGESHMGIHYTSFAAFPKVCKF